MTTEQKAKAYDDALERARALWREAIEKEYANDYLKDYETIFPELRESEDEKIRKWLVDYFGSIKETVWIHRDITCEQILAYLEKQKEQKPASFSCGHENETEWAELQSEFKNINEAFEDGKKEVVAHPEKYGLCKPAEWSEEDELMRTAIIQTLENFGGRGTTGMQISWLKSLQPSWKPSEEDIKMLEHIIGQYETGNKNSKVMGYLPRVEELDFLKKVLAKWKN